MEVADGDRLTLTLADDLTNAQYADVTNDADNPPTGVDAARWHCADIAADPVVGLCLGMPTFSARVVKE